MKIKHAYLYLFYCFYTILQKKDKEKIEGATSLITILLVSIVFSTYFLSHVWFDFEFYYPLAEVLLIALICLIIWYFNRLYFVKRKNSNKAINFNQNKNIIVCRLLGILFMIGQLILFIVSGVITSKHMWGW